MIEFPRTFGRDRRGYCRCCGAGPEWHATGGYGVLCLACWHWLDYVGPRQDWGDGMWEPDDGRWLGRVAA